MVLNPDHAGGVLLLKWKLLRSCRTLRQLCCHPPVTTLTILEVAQCCLSPLAKWIRNQAKPVQDSHCLMKEFVCCLPQENLWKKSWQFVTDTFYIYLLLLLLLRPVNRWWWQRAVKEGKWLAVKVAFKAVTQCLTNRLKQTFETLHLKLPLSGRDDGRGLHGAPAVLSLILLLDPGSHWSVGSQHSGIHRGPARVGCAFKYINKTDGHEGDRLGPLPPPWHVISLPN